MNFKSDLTLGIFIGFVFSLATCLIMNGFIPINEKVILWTFIMGCFVSFLLYITFRHMDKQDSKHAQELQKNAEAECQRLKAIADTFPDFDSRKNNIL